MRPKELGAEIREALVESAADSRRERIATAMLAGLLSATAHDAEWPLAESIAIRAVDYADSLIDALDAK